MFDVRELSRVFALVLVGAGLLAGCAQTPIPRQTVSVPQSAAFFLSSLRQEESFALKFAEESVELSSESMQTLAATAHMAKRWMNRAAVRVEITAVPSKQNKDEQALSTRRMDNIRHVLMAFGLPETVLVTKEEPVTHEKPESKEQGQIHLSLIKIENAQVAALIGMN